jgi:hypothetical protein
MMSHALIPLTDNATRIVAGLGCSEIFFRPGGQPGKTHKKKMRPARSPGWLCFIEEKLREHPSIREFEPGWPARALAVLTNRSTPCSHQETLT